jgi:hypothetical protein
MEIYHIYEKVSGTQEKRVFVKQGISWVATLIPHLWLLYNKAWLIFIVFFALDNMLQFIRVSGDNWSYLMIMWDLYLRVCLGIFASEWRALQLKFAGYEMKEVIAANNLDEAQVQYCLKVA